ncbi:hypothetical protein N0V95_003668 [Ascochyta clinopodiicola]|nr:hypothetical protein N0V95_003668 [Ascochyta clinopodiicola]
MMELDRKLVATATSPVTGHLQLRLQKSETQFLIVFPDGYVLGEINAQLEKVFASIEEQSLQLDFEVFVPTRATREVMSRALKGQDAVVRVQINVYGSRASANSVGQELSQNKVFLQRPDYVREGTTYENPHVLKFSDDCKTITIPKVGTDELSSNKATGQALQQVITDVYSSLTRHDNLKGLEGHERLRTSLLDHQKTALEFMSQRENGPIPKLKKHFGNAEDHMLKVVKYHGQKRTRSLDKLRDADLVITSYHTISKDYTNAKGLLNEVEWYRLVLDEGRSSTSDTLMNTWLIKDSIIFTCWTRTLDLIQLHLLREKLTPSNFKRIDGDCPTSKREKILEEFEKSPALHVLIMTTGTGAVGLNLAIANRVFIVEPQWNPSVENQAIARALRLGQTQAVLVTRYVVESSVEQEMQKLQEEKLKKSSLVKSG